MTTIAYKNGILAADSRLNYKTTNIGKVRKIFKRLDDGALAGGSGSIGNFRRFILAFGEHKQDEFDIESIEDEFVIIFPNGEIWIYEQAGGYPIMSDTYAGGSGAQFALGAMAAGASAEEAVRIACELDGYSGDEVMVLSLK